MHRPPRIPREKARKPEDTGMYLRKTPMVPNTSMEVTIIRTDLRSLAFCSISYFFSFRNRMHPL